MTPRTRTAVPAPSADPVYEIRDEPFTVYRCAECGHIEGETPQAGPCRRCGVRSDAEQLLAAFVAPRHPVFPAGGSSVGNKNLSLGQPGKSVIMDRKLKS